MLFRSGTLDTTITLASDEIAATYKKLGETIQVHVTGTGTGTAGNVTGTISAAEVSGMTFTTASATVTGPANTTDNYTAQDFTFTLGGTVTAKEIAVVFAVT